MMVARSGTIRFLLYLGTAPGMLGDLQAVVFDMDGTLIDSPLDFNAIRAECGAPAGHPVLEYIEQCPEPERSRMLDVLHRHERHAAETCTLRDGADGVLAELAARGLLLALLTRNSGESIRTVLRRFGLRFDCIVSRHDAEPKPSPQPVLKIAGDLGVSPHEMLVVGDYVFDVQSGHSAGAYTAFLTTRQDLKPPAESDAVIGDLRELLDLIPGSGEMPQ